MFKSSRIKAINNGYFKYPNNGGIVRENDTFFSCLFKFNMRFNNFMFNKIALT